MPTNRRERLARIRRFDQLVCYLRDELGWPIASDDFEELTFEFTPEELGIDAKNAAKIQEIKRLRPLAPGQPWGIFFVKFEPKRLPVVALRRILSQVALRKRASANPSEQRAWAADDLLFVSNYGDGDERRIAFAHFSIPQDSRDLPTLKVLGWDNQDTPLHLEAVARELTDHLSWPEDENDPDAWREHWRGAFKLRYREVISTSKELSEHLASLARAIRDRAQAALDIETEKGPLTQLMEAFRTALVHDLDKAGFADMYAQTIAYGLLSARITDPSRRTADDLAEHMRTNPFLRDLMETFLHVGGRRGRAGGPGIDFDELGASEVVELLDHANMEAVVRDFGDQNPLEDPVIHFYEHFLAAYDNKQKVARGVFYTPRPVVSYIVRSVHELLRSEFGLTFGLADTTTWGEITKRQEKLKIPDGTSPDQAFVQILDPATGTGTFLVEIIDLIHRTMTEEWMAQGHGERQIETLWNDYVLMHLLPRLHGYELLMAPYAIAHLKIGLKLYETGYRFESDERARVFLTNALEPPGDKQLTLAFLPALAHEAKAVNEIKQKRRFTVVIGNPPYSGVSSNKDPWIDGLLKGLLPDGTATASYYHIDDAPLGERKVWLQDDYVKFIRLSQWLLDSTGAGVHGYISNHGYLDNPTFRGMRRSLMQSFQRIRVFDLHGNFKRRETPPMDGPDVNVFDIQQGVSIGIFAKNIAEDSIFHVDLWGERQKKYRWLDQHCYINTNWIQLQPRSPFYLFKPFDDSEAGAYYDWPAINEVMPTNVTGVVTARDSFVIDLKVGDLLDRINTFLDSRLTDAVVKRVLGLKENYAWRVASARHKLRAATKRTCLEELVTTILYRPFDERFILWHPSVVWRPRAKVMPHMSAGDNIALISCRQQARTEDKWTQAFVTSRIAESGSISNVTREINYLFPLYLYPGVGKTNSFMLDQGSRGRTPNLKSEFIRKLALGTQLRFVSDGSGDLEGTFGPEDALAWIYAVFHSPGYRERYEPQLKLDFPRVPQSASAKLFRDLVAAGHQLLALHLAESPKLDSQITSYVGIGKPEVGRVGWSENTVWLDAGKTDARAGQRAIKPGTIGFCGVPEEVWDFRIGGYQVCHKWLKDRKGRVLCKEEIGQYQKIVVALNETIFLMAEIDQVIEAHGGWPGAFRAEALKALVM